MASGLHAKQQGGEGPREASCSASTPGDRFMEVSDGSFFGDADYAGDIQSEGRLGELDSRVDSAGELNQYVYDRGDVSTCPNGRNDFQNHLNLGGKSVEQRDNLQMVPWVGSTSKYGPGPGGALSFGLDLEGSVCASLGSEDGEVESDVQPEPDSEVGEAAGEEDLNSRIVIDLSRFFNKKKRKKAAGGLFRGSLSSSVAKYHHARASRRSSSKSRLSSGEVHISRHDDTSSVAVGSPHLAKASAAWNIGKKLGLKFRGSEESLINNMAEVIAEDKRAYDAWKNSM